MKFQTVSFYLISCFLLTLPVLVWNSMLTNKLPAAFQPESFGSGIPAFLTYGEAVSRTLIFLVFLLMPLRIVSRRQRAGLWLFGIGTLLYFLSWLMLMWFPLTAWSTSMAGFMAPAYTPLLWLTGISLSGRSFYFGLPYRSWIPILLSVVFLLFHNAHTYLVYSRIY